jgi:hypothetical protein
LLVSQQNNLETCLSIALQPQQIFRLFFLPKVTCSMPNHGAKLQLCNQHGSKDKGYKALQARDCCQDTNPNSQQTSQPHNSATTTDILMIFV